MRKMIASGTVALALLLFGAPIATAQPTDTPTPPVPATVTTTVTTTPEVTVVNHDTRGGLWGLLGLFGLLGLGGLATLFRRPDGDHVGRGTRPPRPDPAATARVNDPTRRPTPGLGGTDRP